MIIDSHVHLKDLRECRRYLKKMDAHGVDYACVQGGKSEAAWTLLKKQIQTYGPRLVGFFGIDMDRHPAAKVDEAVETGGQGLKFINPQRPYDDEAYFKFYERAEALELPILFHTGFVWPHPGQVVRLDHMRPIRLSTIQRAFGRLRLILAHMGNPFWEEAYVVLWKHRNIYADFTGKTAYGKPWHFWTDLFSFRGQTAEDRVRKLVFGTDNEELNACLVFHHELLERLGASAPTKKLVLGETMARLLGLGGRKKLIHEDGAPWVPDSVQ